MATDQVSGLTGALPGGGLGGVSGVLQGGLNNMLNTGMGFIDRWFPPEKREAVKEKLIKFASEKPYLATFLLSQIALSGLPLALFIIMSITVAIFALLTGLLVGIVGALLFIVFAIGVALLFLLPTLFFTTFAAVAVWLWGLGAYYILKKFNQKQIPGIHIPLKEGLMDQTGLAGIAAPNGDVPPTLPKKSQQARETQKIEHNKKPVKSEHDSSSAKSTGHHADGQENQEQPHSRKHSRPPKLTPDEHVKKAASGTGEAVGGVTKSVGL